MAKISCVQLPLYCLSGINSFSFEGFDNNVYHRAISAWNSDCITTVRLPEGLWCSFDIYSDLNDDEDEDEEEEFGLLVVQSGWVRNQQEVRTWTREYHERDGVHSIVFSKGELLDLTE